MHFFAIKINIYPKAASFPTSNSFRKVFPSHRSSSLCLYILCFMLYHLTCYFSPLTIPSHLGFLSLYWLFFSNYKHTFLLWPIALPQSSLSKSKLLNIILHWPPSCLLLLKPFYTVPLFSIYQNSFLQGHQCLICFSPQLVSKYPCPYSCSAWTIYSIDIVSS